MHRNNFLHRAMVQWHQTHGRDYPWRTVADPYSVLIGEILLQRTQGDQVLPVYQEVIRRWPDAARLARARQSTIERVIAPLGLPKRAQTLKRLGRSLTKLGGVPNSSSELIKLPGVGPYAAHAVPVFSRGKDLPLVDWVIARVLRRYFGLPDDKRPNADKELWTVATDLANRGNANSLWLGTLDFANAVCKPRPLCDQCPLADQCSYRRSLTARPLPGARG